MMIEKHENENENIHNGQHRDDGTKAIIGLTTAPTRKQQNPSPSSWQLLLSFFGLGSSSWVLVNAIYAQIPLIVIAFEYDYTIISKMTLCITTTSLIPILWTTTIVPLLERNQTQTQNQNQQTNVSSSRNDDNNNNNAKTSTKFYWTTTAGIALNLTIGLGVALGVVLSPTATTQLSSLLMVSFCSGIVGTMSLVLYFPHAASTSMISRSSSSSTSFSPAGVVDTDAVVEEQEEQDKAQERNAKNDNIKSEDDNADAATTANAALQQTTAMASGTAVANLFVGVLAIIQFNVVPSNSGSVVLFSLQGYFGVVAGIFVLSIVGFIGTLVIPARARQRALAISVTKPKQTNGTVSSVGIEMEHIHGTNEISVKSQQSSSNYDSDGNCSDTFGSNEPLVRPSNNRQPQNHGSISDPVSLSSKAQQQQQEVQKPAHLLTHLSIDDDGENDDDIEEQQYVSPAAKQSKSSSFSLFVRMSKKHWTLNSAQCVLNVLTFFLPGVVPFSVQHYEDSQRALHFLTVTQLLGQTLGIVFSGYYQNTSVVGQLILFVLLWIPTVTLSIINNTDFQSIQQHSAVPITINALLQFLYGYSSTTFFHLVNREASASTSMSVKDVCDERGVVLESPIDLDQNQQQDDPNNNKNKDGQDFDNEDDGDGNGDDNPHIASRVLGTYNQIGAMIGSLVAYFLVEYKVIS